METILNAPHDRIVREFISEFVDDDLMPLVDTEALDDYICSFSRPTSPTTSLPSYHRISLTLAGCRARPRYVTRGYTRR